MKKDKGSTLVEALVALVILSLGLIPTLSTVLVANSLSSSIRNNLIAANLAQEGIEVARAMRDHNWFSGLPFDFGFVDGAYRVEWNSMSLTPESGDSLLKIDSQGLYNYSSGVDTTFSRRLLITKVDPDGCSCELKIVSEVRWMEKNRTRTISVESHLFNWQ